MQLTLAMGAPLWLADRAVQLVRTALTFSGWSLICSSLPTYSAKPARAAAAAAAAASYSEPLAGSLVLALPPCDLCLVLALRNVQFVPLCLEPIAFLFKLTLRET